MSRATKKSIIAAAIVLPLIVTAMLIRYFARLDISFPGANHVRSGIYIVLLSAWGISVGIRIIQVQARRYLLSISALMVLWMLLRTVKFTIADPDAERILWYMYYLPLLFIPLFAMFVSLSLGKPEDYRLPKWTSLLYLPTVLLLLFVLTNDFHQLVFSFPSGVLSDREYSYARGYFVILAWELGCAASSFIIMLTKCRVPHNKGFLFLPLIPLALSVAYTVAYICGVHWVWLLAGDLTVAQCLIFTACFESCIQCGLIQSNQGYTELFKAADLSVQITDMHGRVKYSTAKVRAEGETLLSVDGEDSVMLDRDTILKRHKLRKGYVFWREDISELNKISEELELTREELCVAGNILEEENKQRERQLRLEEANRLYNAVEKQTSRQVEMLCKLLTEFQETEDDVLARRILGQLIIIGTYVKRRSNLAFVGMQRGAISAQELMLSLNESAENLRLYGVNCRVFVKGGGQLAVEQAAEMYDLFEEVVEAGLDTMSLLLFSVEGGTEHEVNLCTDCEAELALLTERFPDLEAERDSDGLQYLTLRPEKESCGA